MKDAIITAMEIAGEKKFNSQNQDLQKPALRQWPVRKGRRSIRTSRR
jgi:hypothetical protein